MKERSVGELRRAFPAASNGWNVHASGGESHTCVADREFAVAQGTTWSIHATLARAGVQETIDPRRAELESEWVGRTAWTFRCMAMVPSVRDGSRCALAIDLLDGTCDVVLGGEHLGTHRSAFIPFDALIPKQLRGRILPLELHFAAPVAEVLRWQSLLGARPVNGDWTPYNFSRSAACRFGWDWGPRVAGVGFRGARFECWDAARLQPLSLAQTWSDDGACTIALGIDGEHAECRVAATLTSPEGVVTELAEGVRAVTVRPSKLWQPWTLGDRANTAWRVDVAAFDRGMLADAVEARIAPRRVELDTSLDNIGRRFRCIMNGTPIFAKGANLIPALLDGTQVRDWRAEMYRYRSTGFNMIRVWGGGHYMPHAFYRACDDLGILVWQDFMFACAMYPEEEPFASLVAQEAAYQVRRLSSHASIALWCGGNEDLLAWWSWGWKERLKADQSWGRKYWLETLPAAVAAHDPGTPYWAESPYSGSMDRHPNDPDHGDRHTWDAEAKIEGLRRVLPRFCSEFGHQSLPNYVTLEEALPLDALHIGSDALALRQKATGGDAVHFTPELDERFAKAKTLREYAAQTQHLQARAMETGVRWMRANAPRSMGALIWQWNDVWAGHSWSLIDVAGRAKPAWHAVRRACERKWISIEPVRVGESGTLEVVLGDDRCFADPSWFERLRVFACIRRVDFSGVVRAEEKVALKPHAECGLPAATLRGVVPESLLAGADPTRELLTAHIEGAPKLSRATWFLAPDAALQLHAASFEPAPELQARRAEAEVLRATTVIREFWIEARAASSACCKEDSWRTLLPGDIVELAPDEHAWTANCFTRR
jgi:beta-mannosidase